jgi:hypothetical protein
MKVRLAAAQAFQKALEKYEFPIANLAMLAGRISKTALPGEEFEGLYGKLLETFDLIEGRTAVGRVDS